MAKLTSSQARALFETLSEEELKYVADINNTLYQQNSVLNQRVKASETDITGASLHDISLIANLFGYADRFRMLHWSAVNHSTHEQIDNFYKELEKFKDDIAENIQGITGQFAANTITKVELPIIEDPIELLINLKDTVLNYFNSLKEDQPEYEGVRNICSGFLEVCYKYIYLFRICK